MTLDPHTPSVGMGPRCVVLHGGLRNRCRKTEELWIVTMEYGEDRVVDHPEPTAACFSPRHEPSVLQLSKHIFWPIANCSGLWEDPKVRVPERLCSFTLLVHNEEHEDEVSDQYGLLVREHVFEFQTLQAAWWRDHHGRGNVHHRLKWRYCLLCRDPAHRVHGVIRRPLQLVKARAMSMEPLQKAGLVLCRRHAMAQIDKRQGRMERERASTEPTGLPRVQRPGLG
mmetsp:Transcript_19694/g.57484  ORF Transcript_19694/g.57484 Transcript_19694/m.57484 type:complete len:226 (-) Transcript_19694:18-695(-)